MGAKVNKMPATDEGIIELTQKDSTEQSQDIQDPHPIEATPVDKEHPSAADARHALQHLDRDNHKSSDRHKLAQNQEMELKVSKAPIKRKVRVACW